MRILSLNCNGIRAAERKGFFPWLEKQQADFVCLQETRANLDQIPSPAFFPEGYFCHYNPAEKKGYSGTALFARQEPDKIITAYGDDEFDSEGRYLEFRYPKLSVISLYAPSGSSGDVRQQAKFRFMQSFAAHCQKLRKQRRQIVICGDWNIAHREIDLKNWRGNRKNSGFLPEEREWMQQLFSDWGYIDSFRQMEPDTEQYTWWSNRGQAWAKNVGWRIDYQVCTPKLGKAASAWNVYRDERFSDHAPLTHDYDFEMNP